VTIQLWLAILTGRLDDLRTTRRRDNDEGSVSLEQVVIAAGLLAVAVALVAVIVAVVGKYSGKIN
jgi:hypothetical protein